MDKVFIEGLEIETLIGIYDWERQIRQPLVFDLEMAFDNRKPAASDAIGDTLDYKAVSKRLIAFVSQSGFGLVETLAERCAAIVLDEFDVAHVRLKLSKPGAVRGARAVGVIIERSRAGIVETDGTRDVQADRVGEGCTPEVASPAPAIAPSVAAMPVVPAVAAAIDLATGQVSATPMQTSTTLPRLPTSNRFKAATARVYLSLGSNIEPEKHLRAAIAALREKFGNVVVSPAYRTRPVGFKGPEFINAIVVIDSGMHPFALNDWLHALEISRGRDRRDKSYSNRTLDIDIIYFGDLVLEGPGEFQLPRPELHHAFVLKPLADVAPGFVDPIRNVTVAQMWDSHPDRHESMETVAL